METGITDFLSRVYGISDIKKQCRVALEICGAKICIQYTGGCSLITSVTGIVLHRDPEDSKRITMIEIFTAISGSAKDGVYYLQHSSISGLVSRQNKLDQLKTVSANTFK